MQSGRTLKNERIQEHISSFGLNVNRPPPFLRVTDRTLLPTFFFALLVLIWGAL
jgi:hypothetical protein